jgi:hypothetical protein
MTTKATRLTIDGTVGGGAATQVTLNGNALGTPTVTGTTWSQSIDALEPGANNIIVTATDFSENQSSTVITVIQDSVAPALSINPVATRTNKKGHSLSGTVEAGATLEVTAGGRAVPVTVTGTTWSCPIPDLAKGDNAFLVVATDAVGNTSPQGTYINYVEPDGIVNGGSAVGIGDALKVLRVAVGLSQPSSDDLLHGDVAPPGAPDDKLDTSDALTILKKVVQMP